MSKYSRRLFFQKSAITAAGLVIGKYSFSQPAADYTYFSIAELSELVRKKKVSPVELTAKCLKRIELLNPKLKAFTTVTADGALQAAKDAEADIRNGKWKGPLHGIPIALKDNIDTAGVRTTAASGVYKNRVPTKDADITTALKKAGAIILGKLNMHEFALGTTSVISVFGSVHNPWNTDYIAGGSSGGSAAAVAAGLCYAAIGTDTGGSVRLPASCCGVTGLKPTYGLISIEGIIPLAQSVDHVGPICRTVEDTAILLNALVSPQPHQGHCRTDYLNSFNKIKDLKIGVVQNLKVSEEVNTSFKETIDIFKSLGFETMGIEVPQPPPSRGAILPAELEAYHQPLLKQYKDLYDPITLNLINSIINNQKINSSDYINARNEMDEKRNTISQLLFKDINVLILPTTTSVSLSIADAKTSSPSALSMDNTGLFNYYGLPAISIPCGISKQGLPLGLQIVGPKWGEAKVLNVAQKFQKSTQWHLKRPNIR